MKVTGIAGLDKLSAGMTVFGRESARSFAVSTAGAEKMRAGFSAAAAAAAAMRSASTSNGVAKSAALSGYELKNLSFQLNDAITQIATGSSVFQTVAAQGGQVYQVLQGANGGVSGALKDIGSRLMGMITPARLAAVGLVGVGALGAKAFLDYDAAIKQIQVGLLGVGRASGATVADIERISEATSKASDISVSAARDITTALAATGKIGVGNLPDVSKLARGWAALTDSDLPTAGKELAKIFSDPVSGVDTLANRLGVLDDATAQYVKTLAAQGRSQDAIRVMVQAVAPEIQRAAEQTSIWSRAWDAVSSAASQASAAVGKAISDQVAGSSKLQRLAELRADPAGRNQIYQTPGMQAARAQELAELEAWDKGQKAEQQARSESAAAAQRTRAAGEIVRAYDDIGEAIRKVEADREKLGAAIAGSLSSPNERIDGGVEKAIQSYAGLTARIEVLRRQYELGGAAAAAALRQADFDAKTAGLDGYAKSLAQINRQFGEMAEAAKEAGNVRALPTIERSRQAAQDAFAAENAKALSDLQKSSEASLRSTNALTLGERASAAAEEARVQAIQSGRDALYASVSAEQARARVLAEANREARDAVRSAQEAAELAGLPERQREQRQIELNRRRNEERFGPATGIAPSGQGVSIKDVGTGANGQALAQLKTSSGLGFTVAASYAQRFAGFVRDLEATGYKIRSIGGYANRANVNNPSKLSEHAFGRAIDINPDTNPNSLNFKTDLPSNIRELAAAYGLKWGGDFKRIKDTMHFEVAKTALASADKSGTPAGGPAPLPSSAGAADRIANADQQGIVNRDALRYKQEQQDLDAAAAANRILAQSYGASAQAIATMEAKQRLLNEAIRESGSLQQIPQERLQQIDTLAARQGQIAGMTDQLQRGQAAATQFTDSLADGLVNVAINGGKIQDVLKGILAQLASMALKQIFTGGGQGGGLFGNLFGGLFGGGGGGSGGGGLFGGLFGGAFADGGQVPGVGGPRSDNVIARLSPGEYVVNAAATARHGALIHAINMGRLPRFADGGLVGGPMPSMPTIPMATAKPGGRSAVLTNSPTINMTPANGVTPQQLAQVLEQNNKQFARNILPIVRDADRRFG